MPSSTFTIGQVSKRLDVSCTTLRFWEKELGNILVPLRTNGGQRRYTEEHIETIRKIKMLRDTGHSLDQIKERMDPKSSNNCDSKAEIVDRVASEIAQIVRMALSTLLAKEDP